MGATILSLPGQATNRRDDPAAAASASGLDAAAVAVAVLLRVTGERGRSVPVSRILRDLALFAPHERQAAALTRDVERAIIRMSQGDLVHLNGVHVVPAAAIWEHRNKIMGYHVPKSTPWADLRDIHLASRALALPQPVRNRRDFKLGFGLRRVVLENAFRVKFKAVSGYADLRDSLARLALRRGTVRGDAAVASARLSPQLRRAQAASLLQGNPPTPRTDAQLVALLAAQQLGSSGTSPSELRRQLLRRYFAGKAQAAATAPPPARRRAIDPGDFLQEVRNFARQVAQGWQGNRRALISRVFPALAGAHPEWGLDVNRFKSLLAEAHRAGSLNLVNADMRDRGIMAELQASAVAYHNMIMHFIRVEDEASDAA